MLSIEDDKSPLALWDKDHQTYKIFLLSRLPCIFNVLKKLIKFVFRPGIISLMVRSKESCRLSVLPYSFLLKPVALEFECPAVFGDGPDNVIRNALWDVRPDLKSYFHIGIHKGREVLHHFLGDLPGIPAKPRRIEFNRTIEPDRETLFFFSRRRCSACVSTGCTTVADSPRSCCRLSSILSLRTPSD